MDKRVIFDIPNELDQMKVRLLVIQRDLAKGDDYTGKLGWGFKDEETGAAAQERFEGVNPEYVVVGGFEEKYSVYKNVTCGYWYDTEKFPGELVGTLHKVGQRWECLSVKAKVGV